MGGGVVMPELEGVFDAITSLCCSSVADYWQMSAYRSHACAAMDCITEPGLLRQWAVSLTNSATLKHSLPLKKF